MMRPLKKLAFLALLGALSLSPWVLGQNGTPVSEIPFPYSQQPSVIFTYSGGNLVYQCITRSSGPWNNSSVPSSFSWTRAATTLTSVVVATNTATATTSTAHGLRVGNAITVAGTTGDTDLNASWVIATVPSSTTFTFTTSGVSDGTYNNAAMTLTSSAPRSNTAIWAIEKFLYDGSNNLIGTYWAGGAPTYVNSCDSAATYSYR